MADQTYSQFSQLSQEQLSALLLVAQQQQQQTEFLENTATDDFEEEEEEDHPQNTELVSFEKEIFLEEVRKYPCLWNISNHSYKDRNVKNNAWMAISKVFGENVEFLQRQLKNLKDTLKKCLDKRSRMGKSGAAAASLPKYKFFDQMSFLHERTADRPPESNIELTSSEAVFFSPPPSPAVSLASPGSAPKKTLKRKRDEDVIIKELSNIEKELKISTEPECEDSLFCRSLIPTLKRLPPKINKKAKIKISQLLYELEFENVVTNNWKLLYIIKFYTMHLSNIRTPYRGICYYV